MRDKLINDKFLFVFLAFFLAIVFCSASAAASDLAVTSVSADNEISPGGEVNITTKITNTGSTTASSVNVGYQMHDEKPIAQKTEYQGKPAMYGDKIVWQDYRNGDYDIYMYDLTTKTETQITTNTATQQNPIINGDKIVWQDQRNGNYDIYMYDLTTKTETQITTNTQDQYNPSIYGNKIVWQDQRNGNYDIYMYDLTTKTETQITTNTATQENPNIYGDKIVWDDQRNGNYDIYMYDLTTKTETQITTNTATQENPNIYGDKIVWHDLRNGNWDIYMYDLTTKTETQITTNTANEAYAFLYGDKIVWHDSRNGNWDIYMSDGLVLLGDYNVISSITAGATSTISAMVDLPSDLETGVNYYFSSIAGAGSTSNNLKVDSTPAVVPDVDLIVQKVYVPSTAALGYKILVSNTIKNIGKELSNSFNIYFYLSKDTTITTSDIYLGQRTITSLAADSTNAAYTQLTIPTTAGTGNYYLGIIIDPSNQVVEENEDNNYGYTDTTITMRSPELTITSLISPLTIYRGSKIKVTDTLKNSGNLGITKSFNVNYYLSKDTIITTSDIYLGKRTITSLASGSTNTNTTQLYIPGTITAGGYYIGAIVDPTNIIIESNETNNAKRTSKAIVKSPKTYKDLTITKFTAPTTGTKGGTIKITDSVKNIGNTKVTTPFYIYYYLSTDNNITTTDIYIGKRLINSLNAGSTSTHSPTLTIPNSITKGTYYIAAIADPTNTNTELYENNNIKKATNTITIT